MLFIALPSFCESALAKHYQMTDNKRQRSLLKMLRNYVVNNDDKHSSRWSIPWKLSSLVLTQSRGCNYHAINSLYYSPGKTLVCVSSWVHTHSKAHFNVLCPTVLRCFILPMSQKFLLQRHIGVQERHGFNEINSKDSTNCAFCDYFQTGYEQLEIKQTKNRKLSTLISKTENK